jgi:hypothetical protein
MLLVARKIRGRADSWREGQPKDRCRKLEQPVGPTAPEGIRQAELRASSRTTVQVRQDSGAITIRQRSHGNGKFPSPGIRACSPQNQEADVAGEGRTPFQRPRLTL